jgi:D-3-phosphoglycerate dehydrogenase
MPKIVIVDRDFEDQGIEKRLIADAGFEVAAFQSRKPQDIIRNAADADGIITSYGVFTRQVFEALPQLKVLSRTGVGYDLIDVQAATDCGVAVCTHPGYGTEVVSDHAITLALDVLRRTNELDADMRRGIWNHQARRPLGQVYGRTFGIVGMGEIGRAVARKAAGLGFKVICTSRSLKPGRRTPEGFETFNLDVLLEMADVISFHCALTPDTHHLLNEERIRRLKPGAIVVNTSRGQIIDTVALARALEANKIWGAGLDVFEDEPFNPSHPIFLAPHTVLTPHAAYFSEESAIELCTRSARAVIDVLQGRMPADCLNPQVLGWTNG